MVVDHLIPGLLIIFMIAGVVNDIMYQRKMRRAEIRQWIVRCQHRDLEDTLTDLGLGKRKEDQ